MKLIAHNEEYKKNIQCEFKKGNSDSILNLSKAKGKIMKFLSVDDSMLISFMWYIGHSYWVRDGCSAIIFVKHFKTVFVQVLSYSTLCSHKSHHAAQTTPTWTKIILTCFTKLIDVQPFMAEYE